MSIYLGLEASIQWAMPLLDKQQNKLLVNSEKIQGFKLFRSLTNNRYKNDVRYLELWLTVAKKQRDPTDLFKYLIVNGIGQESALFYEEYAGFKETFSRFFLNLLITL